jgi:serine/threonine protein phosphatase PrpC
MLRFTWAAHSHVGLVRTNNEDSGFAGPYLLLVADGVGGAAAGEVASASTTYVTATLAMAAGDRPPLDVLTEAVARSHQLLRDGVAAAPERAGMATTLTAVLGDGTGFGLVHVGDSRGYLRRDGELTRVTRDHTLVQQLLDEREITADEAARHPYRSMVLRSVDADLPPQPDLVRLDLREGDRVLLCSDGLSDLVADADIARLLAAPDLDDAVRGLVEAALAAGGRDNITCVAGDVVEAAGLLPDGTLVGAVRDLDNQVDPAAIHLPHPA